MKRIKQYKIFESKDDDFLNEVKECFLPVIDIVQDDLEMKMCSTMQKEKYVVIQIKFPKEKNIMEELINEIADSMYHCRGYNINVSGINIKYKLRRINADSRLTSLIKEINPNIEDDFIKISLSLLEKNEINKIYFYLDNWK